MLLALVRCCIPLACSTIGINSIGVYVLACGIGLNMVLYFIGTYVLLCVIGIHAAQYSIGTYVLPCFIGIYTMLCSLAPHLDVVFYPSTTTLGVSKSLELQD